METRQRAPFFSIFSPCKPDRALRKERESGGKKVLARACAPPSSAALHEHGQFVERGEGEPLAAAGEVDSTPTTVPTTPARSEASER